MSDSITKAQSNTLLLSATAPPFAPKNFERCNRPLRIGLRPRIWTAKPRQAMPSIEWTYIGPMHLGPAALPLDWRDVDAHGNANQFECLWTIKHKKTRLVAGFFIVSGL